MRVGRRKVSSAQGSELKRLPPLLIVSLTFLFTARNVLLALAFKEIGAVGLAWTCLLNHQHTALVLFTVQEKEYVRR
jgi:hypothetical protein